MKFAEDETEQNKLKGAEKSKKRSRTIAEKTLQTK